MGLSQAPRSHHVSLPPPSSLWHASCRKDTPTPPQVNIRNHHGVWGQQTSSCELLELPVHTQGGGNQNLLHKLFHWVHICAGILLALPRNRRQACHFQMSSWREGGMSFYFNVTSTSGRSCKLTQPKEKGRLFPVPSGIVAMGGGCSSFRSPMIPSNQPAVPSPPATCEITHAIR